MKSNITSELTVSEAGRIGGKKSKRLLTTDQARKMVEAREAKKCLKGSVPLPNVEES